MHDPVGAAISRPHLRSWLVRPYSVSYILGKEVKSGGSKRPPYSYGSCECRGEHWGIGFFIWWGVVNVCHPERSEAESKDLNAMVGVMAVKTDEDNALEILHFVQDDNGIGDQAKNFP